MQTKDLTDAFGKAITHILKTMAKIEPHLDRIEFKEKDHLGGDVSGILGLSSGSKSVEVALSFSKEAALIVYSAMLGEKATEIDASVVDLVGELTNMLGGNARSTLSEKGISFTSTLPMVVIGKQEHSDAGEISANMLFNINGHRMFIEISLA